jgi:hypothetical protein
MYKVVAFDINDSTKVSGMLVPPKFYYDSANKPQLPTLLHYQHSGLGCSCTQVSKVAKIAMKTEGDVMCGRADLTDI